MTSPLTLAVMSFKGGVGKTVITSNTACAWAQAHPDTYGLVLDFDPQRNLTMSLASLVSQHGSLTTEGLLTAGIDTPGAVLNPQETTQVAVGEGRFDLVPVGSPEALEGTERALVLAAHGAWVLRNLLAGNGYDWIVIDTRPAAGLLTTNAVAAATHAVGVVTPSLWSIKGGTEISTYVANNHKTRISDATFAGSVVNRVKGQKTDNQELALEALREVSPHLMEPFIPEGIAIPEGETFGEPAVSSNPKSTPAKALMTLAENLWNLRSAPAEAVAQ